MSDTQTKSAALPQAAGFALMAGVAVAATLATADRAALAVGLPFLIVLVTATASSLPGFPFSAICSALVLPLFPDPVTGVGLVMLCSVANQVLVVWHLRRASRWRMVAIFVAGGSAGVPVGVMLLLTLDRAMVLHVLGIVMILVAAQRLLLTQRPRAGTLTVIDLAAGAASGLLAGFCGPMGAPLAMRAGMKPWLRDEMRGSVQPAILLVQVEALICLFLMRGTGLPPILGLSSLVFVPLSLLGCRVGLGVLSRCTDRGFARAVNVAVLTSGVALMI